MSFGLMAYALCNLNKVDWLLFFRDFFHICCELEWDYLLYDLEMFTLMIKSQINKFLLKILSQFRCC